MKLWFVWAWAVLLSLSGSAPLRAQAHPETQRETVIVNARAKTTPFPHFWERMFGSGRANLSLRASYREDLRTVKGITGLQYVRFHGILDRDVGVYSEDAQGKPTYNFNYVDQIYDGLLAQGVRPFVEISFMPEKLALRSDLHPFWYHPTVSPPADYAKWDALMHAFAEHLVRRYGIDEVSKWYFEVWNEPNIGFWTGKPAQESYFKLYDHTARDLKAVNPRLRIGGPATAQAAWVPDMLRHTQAEHVPLDFVSTHVYGNDTAENVFGHPETISPHGMVSAAVEKVYREVQDSKRPHIPIIWSEFNASYNNDPEVTDSTFMGPWLANMISQCDGKTTMMSFWTFSDVFEEQGIARDPFYGGFGLIATDHLPKPSFYAFKLLHELGTERIPVSGANVLATKRTDGAVVLAAWNGTQPGATGPEDTFHFELKGIPENATAGVSRVDGTHGNILAAYDAMGSPLYPTKDQQRELRQKSRLPAPESISLRNGSFTLTVPSQGLAVITIR